MSGQGRREGRGGSTDPYVVRTEDLARIVNKWIAEHNQDHPKNLHGGFASADNRENNGTGSYESPESMPVTTGLQFIAERVGIDPTTIAWTLRCRTQWTSLARADEILTAVGLSHLLRIELIPVPNPTWSPERWQAWHAEHGACTD